MGKKIVPIILAVCLIVSIAGCGQPGSSAGGNPTSPPNTQNTDTWPDPQPKNLPPAEEYVAPTLDIDQVGIDTSPEFKGIRSVTEDQIMAVLQKHLSEDELKHMGSYYRAMYLDRTTSGKPKGLLIIMNGIALLDDDMQGDKDRYGVIFRSKTGANGPDSFGIGSFSIQPAGYGNDPAVGLEVLSLFVGSELAQEMMTNTTSELDVAPITKTYDGKDYEFATYRDLSFSGEVVIPSENMRTDAETMDISAITAVVDMLANGGYPTVKDYTWLYGNKQDAVEYWNKNAASTLPNGYEKTEWGESEYDCSVITRGGTSWVEFRANARLYAYDHDNADTDLPSRFYVRGMKIGAAQLLNGQVVKIDEINDQSVNCELSANVTDAGALRDVETCINALQRLQKNNAEKTDLVWEDESSNNDNDVSKTLPGGAKYTIGTFTHNQTVISGGVGASVSATLEYESPQT